MKYAKYILMLLGCCHGIPARPQASQPLPGARTRSLPAVERRPVSVTADLADQARFPDPEMGSLTNDTYKNSYFALSHLLPPHWTEGFKGPAPSDTGYYVLSSLRPADKTNGVKATTLIAAWDLFFIPRPVNNAIELVEDMKKNLSSVYTVDVQPTRLNIGSHPFARLEYSAKAAQLHWAILATESRCHILQFVFTSRDPALVQSLTENLNQTKLSADPGTAEDKVPACIKDYATGSNVVRKVDPIMVGPKFTSVPVRFVIGVNGRVTHIHVINAFPEQAKSVEDALRQWIFKPYTVSGVPAEVETGILFKFPPEDNKAMPSSAASRKPGQVL